MKLKVIDQKGKAAGEISVSKSVFGAEVNVPLIHEVAVAQQNNQRQGTKSALTRSEVRGHAKKPHRQKGTGKARQGSSKSVHHVGGGIAHTPKPRDFRTKINKQKKTAAFVSAISGKVADNELLVLKSMDLKESKTKEVVAILEALKIDGKSVMFVTAGKDELFMRGANNIQRVKVNTAEQVSVLDVVQNKFLVLSQEAVKLIDASYTDEADDKEVA